MDGRVCVVCGKPILRGMTNEGNGFPDVLYCCEEHFGQYMDREHGAGNWMDAEDDGCGGYYMARDDGGGWRGTGFYWTEWEEEWAKG